ncbi:MAG: glycosyltransferase [Pseudomonadota bacterium]
MPFDADWYLKTYPEATEAVSSGKAKSALAFYMLEGAAVGHNPSDLFCEKSYLQTHLDVDKALSENQFISGYHHYMLHGAKEGRLVTPPGRSATDWQTAPPVAPPASSAPELPVAAPAVPLTRPAEPTPPDTHRAAREANVAALSRPTGNPEHFAEKLYLTIHGDVAAGVTAGAIRSGCEHWLSSGFREDLLGNRPRVPGYSESRYLAQNSDVAIAVHTGGLVSGYHHFLTYGWSEGRPGGPETQTPSPMRNMDIPFMTRRMAQWDAPPLISLIVPVYETHPTMLRAMIASVEGQAYSHWELCLADDGSSTPHTREVLTEAAARDDRIKVHFLPRNGGISAASNAALEMASGQYIGLLDHDDTLTQDALFEVAAVIMDHPDTDVIYSDEDKMSEDGARFFNPAYKPGWSPDLLRCTMYIGHLTTYRADLIKEVGGFRSAFDGTQDYDLALRATAHAKSIRHIPKVLYHWRISDTSTAGDMSNKSYVLDRQQAAVTSLLKDQGIKGEVAPVWSPGHWRVSYAPPSPLPKVSIVIPSAGYSTTVAGRELHLLLNCIESLDRVECYDDYEIVVVHNDDLSEVVLEKLNANPRVKLVAYTDQPFNFSEKINMGVAAATGEYVLLLNDDIEAITPRFLHDMVGHASQDGVGAVGARLLFGNDTIQHTGVLLTRQGPTHKMIGEHALVDSPINIVQLPHNVAAATGACLLMRRDLYQELGGFDEGLPLNYNDVDLCLKIRAAGHRIVVDPVIRLYHFESLSKTGTYGWEVQKFLERWKGTTDPYLNPNFDAASPFYALADLSHAEEDVPFPELHSRRLALRRPSEVKQTIHFSFIMSIYRQPLKFLRELADTVFNQHYQNFEWIIVDDCSETDDVNVFLNEMQSHPKVTVIRNPRNLGIMGGYKRAFDAATGDYVLPIDADDLLTIDALSIMADAIVTRGQPAVLYSDEFKSNESSSIFAPFHKPDWDPLLFTNVCFLAHLCAMRRDVAKEVDVYSDGTATWCHDWDSFWRVVRAGHDPVHVPEALYGWRINPGSTASVESGTKPGTINSQTHVLTQHVRLSGMDRTVESVENTLFPHNGIWRLKPKTEALPSAHVVWDLRQVTDLDGVNLDQVLPNMGQGLTPGLTVLVATTELETAIKSAFEGHGNAPDVAIETGPLTLCDTLKAASKTADYVSYIGPTLQFESPDWLAEMLGLLETYGNAALAGGRILNTSDTLLWAGGYFGIGGGIDSPDFGRKKDDSGYHGFVWCQRFVDGVSNAFWAVQSDVLAETAEKLGPKTTPAEWATALSLATYAAGKNTIYTPFATAISSNNRVLPAVANQTLSRKIGAKLPEQSRFYSPRLSRRAGHWFKPIVRDLENGK